MCTYFKIHKHVHVFLRLSTEDGGFYWTEENNEIQLKDSNFSYFSWSLIMNCIFYLRGEVFFCFFFFGGGVLFKMKFH